MTKNPRRKSDAARRANQVIRGRTMLVMLVLGVATFTVLFMKLYNLQITQHDHLKALATEQQTDSMVISASRGTIYDKNGEIMAISYDVENVILDPGGIQDFVESQEQTIQDAAEKAAEEGEPYTAPEVLDQAYIARGLSRILDVEEETILKHLEDTSNRYWVAKKKVDSDVADEVRRFINGEIDDEGNQLTTVDADGNTVLISTGGRPKRLQGITLLPDTKRLYPFGSLAGNVLGFVNANNVGAYGLEAAYDSVLNGSTGLTITPINVNGTPLLFSGSEQMFDAEDGNSLQKTFLKAPLRYSRISSGFSNNRFHPVLKRYRAHHGVDYAAPTGTPVHTVGDGVVVKKAYQKNGGGNYVTIKHNSVYTTTYMHLSKFAKGIKVGTRVKQGETIGYVGATGLATGPHLDYRVYKNGTPINPLKMVSPPKEPISAASMPRFTHVRDSLVQLLRQL